MKTIGLIGGMSWESSSEYYRMINEAVRARLGGLHSARCIMYSVDFADIEPLQQEGRWPEAAGLLIAAARNLQRGGADFLVLCTNTMHKLANEIEKHTEIPLLHIADATAQVIKVRGLSKVGLLGTRFTMEEEFYKGRLTHQHAIAVLVPNQQQRAIVHRAIYDELCLGRIVQSSKQQYLAIIDELANRGAEGVILGCTEIGLLVKAEDSRVPLFDTTKIHAEAAVAYALEA